MADAHSPSDAPQRLTAIRGEIDSVDQELLALFNRRAALSLEVGRIKAGDRVLVTAFGSGLTWGAALLQF